MLGDHVGLFGEAVVDVSGDAGGGTVLIGGDYQGKNPAIQNAQAAFVSPDAQIKADALTLGNGGKVVVWSEASTRFYGSISARGGAQGGNGGSVETSGHFLDFHGTVSTLAPLGVVGRLLLDPTDLTIDNNPDLNVTAATPFVPTASPSHLSWGTIDTALGGGAVTVTTVGSPNSGVEVGDITIATASPALNRNNKLTLSAAGAITVNSGSTIMNSGTGDLELDAVGPVTINAGITLKGNLSVSGAGISSSAALVVNGALKTATFAAGSGNDITLGNGANDFTTVAITSGRNVTLNDINKIDLGASTISGTLGVTAAGAITQSGALAVTSVASFTAGANGITLSDAGNNFAGPVTVNNTGANDVVLRNAGDLTVGGSVGRNLMVTAGGSISDTSGALIVAGNSTFTLTAANTDVLLDTQPNSLGGVTTIALSGGSLLDLGLRNISGSASYPTLPPASPMNNLNLIFDTSGVTFPTPITLAGNLSVTAGMGVTLPTAITLGGNLSVTAGMPTTLRGTYSASTFNVVNAAVLSADTTISAGTIAFGGTVNGGHNLVANSAGATTFGGVVGGTTALTSLTSDAAGTVSLVGAKTSGAQNYQDGTVTLSGTYAASTFNVPNAAVLAGDTTVGATTTIGFGGTVDGAHNLAANSAGATSFGGLVGSATPLTSLTTDDHRSTELPGYDRDAERHLLGLDLQCTQRGRTGGRHHSGRGHHRVWRDGQRGAQLDGQ